MPVELKLSGIFRSGTNLLKLLVETHLDAVCRSNVGGQKHLFTPVFWNANGYVEDDIPLLVCVKDPYAAMTSLYRYARDAAFKHFDCEHEWSQFLSGRFVVAIDHPSRPPAFLFRSPVDYWNAHTFHMLSLESKRRIIVRYEDLLTNPTSVLASISERFSVSRKTTGEVEIPGQTVKRMGEVLLEQPLQQQAFDPLWYLERRFMKEFTPDQVRFMRQTLDEQVLERLGYAFA